MTLGERITAARKARGLTQQQLASMFGDGFQAVNVWRWEKDKHRPSVGHVAILHRELGIPLEALLAADDDHPPIVTPAAVGGESAS